VRKKREGKEIPIILPIRKKSLFRFIDLFFFFFLVTEGKMKQQKQTEKERRD